MYEREKDKRQRDKEMLIEIDTETETENPWDLQTRTNNQIYIQEERGHRESTVASPESVPRFGSAREKIWEEKETKKDGNEK